MKTCASASCTCLNRVTTAQVARRSKEAQRRPSTPEQAEEEAEAVAEDAS